MLFCFNGLKPVYQMRDLSLSFCQYRFYCYSKDKGTKTHFKIQIILYPIFRQNLPNLSTMCVKIRNTATVHWHFL